MAKGDRSFIDLTHSLPFNRLTVIEQAPNKGKRTAWHCRCACGNFVIATGHDLRSGNTQSCGCWNKEILKTRGTHGQARKRHEAPATPEYGAWSGMIQRCTNSRTRQFGDYGGRGIRVCQGFRDFAFFFSIVGKRTSSQHSFDRRDNNKHYSCGQCVECQKQGWEINVRWATKVEQANNTRANNRFTYKGQTRTMREWADHLQINYSTLRDRIHEGWTVERALTTLVKQKP